MRLCVGADLRACLSPPIPHAHMLINSLTKPASQPDRISHVYSSLTRLRITPALALATYASNLRPDRAIFLGSILLLPEGLVTKFPGDVFERVLGGGEIDKEFLSLTLGLSILFFPPFFYLYFLCSLFVSFLFFYLLFSSFLLYGLEMDRWMDGRDGGSREGKEKEERRKREKGWVE